MNLTPIIIISAKYPEHLKDIKKQTKRLPSPWPKEGTFDVVACEDMERRIKDHKLRDKSQQRQKKRELESEGLRHRRNLREGVAILRNQQVEVDKINQHYPAGLYPSLIVVVKIQGDFEMTDHK